MCVCPPPDPALNYDWLAPDTIALLIRRFAPTPRPAARGDPNHLPAAGGGKHRLHTMTTVDRDNRDRVVLSPSLSNMALTLLELLLLLYRVSIGYNSSLCATVSTQYSGREAGKQTTLSCSFITAAAIHVNQNHQVHINTTDCSTVIVDTSRCTIGLQQILSTLQVSK